MEEEEGWEEEVVEDVMEEEPECMPGGRRGRCGRKGREVRKEWEEASHKVTRNCSTLG